MTPPPEISSVCHSMTREGNKGGDDGIYSRIAEKEVESAWKRNSGVPRAPGNGVQAGYLLPHSFLSSAAETVVFPSGEEFYTLGVKPGTKTRGWGLWPSCDSLLSVATNLPP